MSGMMLMRLRDCAFSTMLGMVDQWPGPEMVALKGMGYVKQVGKGHQATKEGFAYLASPDRAEPLRKL